MRPDRQAAAAVGASVIGLWIVAAGALWQGLDRAALWFVPVTVLSVLWALVEGHYRGSGHSPERQYTIGFLRFMLAWAAASVSSFVAIQWLAAPDLLGPGWASGGSRVSGLVIASGLVLFGNALPTLGPPRPLATGPHGWQRLRRFIGWTLVLSGLAIAGAWIALDPTRASRATNRLLALSFLLILGRSMVSAFGRSAPQALSR